MIDRTISCKGTAGCQKSVKLSEFKPSGAVLREPDSSHDNHKSCQRTDHDGI